MAARDFMPFKSPLGGTYEVRHAGMTASGTFDVGEPLVIVTAGTLTEPSATGWVLTDFSTTSAASVEGGIACFGPGAGNINPETGVAYTTNDTIAYWPINQGILFITRIAANFRATGASAAGATAAPLVTDIGESYEMSSNGTNWAIERTGAAPGTDVQADIVDVLDVNKAPIRLSGGTGVYAVFEINATLAAA
jgi:hypothetical protein